MDPFDLLLKALPKIKAEGDEDTKKVQTAIIDAPKPAPIKPGLVGEVLKSNVNFSPKQSFSQETSSKTEAGDNNQIKVKKESPFQESLKSKTNLLNLTKIKKGSPLEIKEKKVKDEEIEEKKNKDFLKLHLERKLKREKEMESDLLAKQEQKIQCPYITDVKSLVISEDEGDSPSNDTAKDKRSDFVPLPIDNSFDEMIAELKAIDDMVYQSDEEVDGQNISVAENICHDVNQSILVASSPDIKYENALNDSFHDASYIDTSDPNDSNDSSHTSEESQYGSALDLQAEDEEATAYGMVTNIPSHTVQGKAWGEIQNVDGGLTTTDTDQNGSPDSNENQDPISPTSAVAARDEGISPSKEIPKHSMQLSQRPLPKLPPSPNKKESPTTFSHQRDHDKSKSIIEDTPPSPNDSSRFKTLLKDKHSLVQAKDLSFSDSEEVANTLPGIAPLPLIPSDEISNEEKEELDLLGKNETLHSTPVKTSEKVIDEIINITPTDKVMNSKDNNVTKITDADKLSKKEKENQEKEALKEQIGKMKDDIEKKKKDPGLFVGPIGAVLRQFVQTLKEIDSPRVRKNIIKNVMLQEDKVEEGNARSILDTPKSANKVETDDGQTNTISPNKDNEDQDKNTSRENIDDKVQTEKNKDDGNSTLSKLNVSDEIDKQIPQEMEDNNPKTPEEDPCNASQSEPETITAPVSNDDDGDITLVGPLRVTYPKSVEDNYEKDSGYLKPVCTTDPNYILTFHDAMLLAEHCDVTKLPKHDSKVIRPQPGEIYLIGNNDAIFDTTTTDIVTDIDIYRWRNNGKKKNKNYPHIERSYSNVRMSVKRGPCENTSAFTKDLFNQTKKKVFVLQYRGKDCGAEFFIPAPEHPAMKKNLGIQRSGQTPKLSRKMLRNLKYRIRGRGDVGDDSPFRSPKKKMAKPNEKSSRNEKKEANISPTKGNNSPAPDVPLDVQDDNDAMVVDKNISQQPNIKDDAKVDGQNQTGKTEVRDTQNSPDKQDSPSNSPKKKVAKLSKVTKVFGRKEKQDPQRITNAKEKAHNVAKSLINDIVNDIITDMDIETPGPLDSDEDDQNVIINKILDNDIATQEAKRGFKKAVPQAQIEGYRALPIQAAKTIWEYARSGKIKPLDASAYIITDPKPGDIYFFDCSKLNSSWENHLTRDTYRWKIQSHTYIMKANFDKKKYVSMVGKERNFNYSRYTYYDTSDLHALIHYRGSCENIERFPHGNSIHKDNIFYPTSGVVKDLIQADPTKGPTEQLRSLSGDRGSGLAGVITAPRNIRQVKYYSSKLLEQINLSADETKAITVIHNTLPNFVRKQVISPHLSVTLIDDLAVSELVNVLNMMPEDEALVINYDTTYEFGDYLLTIASYRHPALERTDNQQNVNKEPIVPFAFFCHDKRLKSEHRDFMTTITNAIDSATSTKNGFSEKKKNFISDREFDADDLGMSNTQTLHCWLHIIKNVDFKANKLQYRKADKDMIRSDLYNLLKTQTGEARYIEKRDAILNSGQSPLCRPEMQEYFMKFIDKSLRKHACAYILKEAGIKDPKSGITNNAAEAINSALKPLTEGKRLKLPVAILLLHNYSQHIQREVQQGFYKVEPFRVKDDYKQFEQETDNLPASDIKSRDDLIKGIENILNPKTTNDGDESPTPTPVTNDQEEDTVQKLAQWIVTNKKIDFGQNTNTFTVRDMDGSAFVVTMAPSCTCNSKGMCSHYLAVVVSTGHKKDFTLDRKMKMKNKDTSKTSRKIRKPGGKVPRKEDNVDRTAVGKPRNTNPNDQKNQGIISVSSDSDSDFVEPGIPITIPTTTRGRTSTRGYSRSRSSSRGQRGRPPKSSIASTSHTTTSGQQQTTVISSTATTQVQLTGNSSQILSSTTTQIKAQKTNTAQQPPQGTTGAPNSDPNATTKTTSRSGSPTTQSLIPPATTTSGHQLTTGISSTATTQVQLTGNASQSLSATTTPIKAQSKTTTQQLPQRTTGAPNNDPKGTTKAPSRSGSPTTQSIQYNNSPGSNASQPVMQPSPKTPQNTSMVTLHVDIGNIKKELLSPQTVSASPNQINAVTNTLTTTSSTTQQTTAPTLQTTTTGTNKGNSQIQPATVKLQQTTTTKQPNLPLKLPQPITGKTARTQRIASRSTYVRHKERDINTEFRTTTKTDTCLQDKNNYITLKSYLDADETLLSRRYTRITWIEDLKLKIGFHQKDKDHIIIVANDPAYITDEVKSMAYFAMKGKVPRTKGEVPVLKISEVLTDKLNLLQAIEEIKKKKHPTQASKYPLTCYCEDIFSDPQTKNVECTTCPNTFHPDCILPEEKQKVKDMKDWKCKRCIVPTNGVQWNAGDYTNTCPVDNFFTALELLTQEDPTYWKNLPPKIRDDKDHKILKEVIDSCTKGNYEEAHAKWYDHMVSHKTQTCQAKNKDMHGNETGMIQKYINPGHSFTIRENCDNEKCKAKPKERIQNRVTVAKATDDLQRDILMAMSETILPYKCKSCKTGKIIQSTLLREKNNPWFLPVDLDCVKISPVDIQEKLPQSIDIDGKEFHLRQVNLYQNDHFTSMLKYKGFWYHYDGMKPEGQRFQLPEPHTKYGTKVMNANYYATQ